MREPKQKRSMEKKEEILSAANDLFSEKGYYNTNTPEIAARAGVSVGCLYSYFSDKHVIFMELLDRMSIRFDQRGKELEDAVETVVDEPKDWFRKYMEMLIAEHLNSKGMQREQKVLYYYDPEVAEYQDRRREQIQKKSLLYIEKFKDRLCVKDTQAAAIVSSDIIEAIVERISFYKNSVDRERILNEGVNAVCRYLIG